MKAELLEKYLEKLDKIEDFVVSKAPDFIQDLVKLQYTQIQNKVIDAVISLAVYISLFTSGSLILRYLYNSDVACKAQHFRDDCTDYGLVMVFGGVGLTMLALLILISAAEIVQSKLLAREYAVSDKILAANAIRKALKGKFYS